MPVTSQRWRWCLTHCSRVPPIAVVELKNVALTGCKKRREAERKQWKKRMQGKKKMEGKGKEGNEK